MKKNIVTRALVILLGLISLTENSKAETVYYSNTANQSYGSGGLIYVASAQSAYVTEGINYNVGFLGFDFNGNGLLFNNYISYYDPEIERTVTFPANLASNPNITQQSAALLSNGSTVDASTALAGWDEVAPEITANEQFIGLAAYAGGQTYYGWAGFTFLNGVFSVHEAAFNSAPNSGITINGTVTVPEPSALSLLAIGLGGWAMMLRRRRS